MPKQTERERLVDLESRRRKLDDEVERARYALRVRYGAMISDLPVESLTEREFREVLLGAIRIGGDAAVMALTGVPGAAPDRKARAARPTAAGVE